MTLRRVLCLGAGLLTVWSPVPARAAPPPKADRAAPSPEWVARRDAWNDARRAFRAARWGGTVDEIGAAQSRVERADSAYIASLATWASSDSGAAGPTPLGASRRAALRHATLDLVERGRGNAASAILNGPLRADPALLPLRARSIGLRQSPDSGLALLGWPHDRRMGPDRPIRWDFQGRAPGEIATAAHLVAAELADSADDPRAARAALWRLLDHSRPAVRTLARTRLARSLVDRGEPRLAQEILQEGTFLGERDEEAVLLAELKGSLAAALSDTVTGANQLIYAANEGGIPTSVRYAIAMRARDWISGSRADSLTESAWLDLVRILGSVGEAERALSLFARRRVAAPDPPAALARAEVEAGLLARLRRHSESAAAYEKLLGRVDLPRDARARFALGLARARRGMGEFAKMDSAFLLAVSLDSTGATASLAAWERAREWEDRRAPAEAAAVYDWSWRTIRDPSLIPGVVTHGVIAHLRAGTPDSAMKFITGRWPVDLSKFWVAQVRFAQGDSAAGYAAYRQVAGGDWTYEVVRAREELDRKGIAWEKPPSAPRGKQTASAKEGASRRRAMAPEAEPDAPLAARLLGGTGGTALMVDALRDCSQRDDRPEARTCTNALEELGVFRVGRQSNVPAERLQYPPAYPDDVLAAAARESLSAALLWAIMRQESAYQRTARSKAGAIGLLQLLPSTAARLNRAAVTEPSLTEADLNVRLGARYIRNLLLEFQDPRAAMAAYNAGEDAVRRWLKDRPRVDDMWVELIPYRETRDYVKQVYSIWRRYEALYGLPRTAG